MGPRHQLRRRDRSSRRCSADGRQQITVCTQGAPSAMHTVRRFCASAAMNCRTPPAKNERNNTKPPVPIASAAREVLCPWRGNLNRHSCSGFGAGSFFSYPKKAPPTAPSTVNQGVDSMMPCHSAGPLLNHDAIHPNATPNPPPRTAPATIPASILSQTDCCGMCVLLCTQRSRAFTV